MNTSHRSSPELPQEHAVASIARRRKRAWSISRSSMTDVVQADHRAYGSFTTTVPAAFWLRSYLSLPVPYNLHGKQRDAGWADEYNFEPTESSPSRFSPPHRPSISRTSSMTSTMGKYPIGPSSPPHSRPISLLGENTPAKLHPVLEAVERASKLSYHTACVTCLKTGRDFPCCPRCGDMWCSRECRMQGGKRHVCRV